MQAFLLFTGALVLVTGCFGLDLTIDNSINLSANHGGVQPDTCGQLLCVEDLTDTRPATLTSMAVYKRRSAISMGRARSRRRVHVASISQHSPSISLVTHDGLKINGFLTDTHAYLRLDLVEQDDCDAELSCEIRVLDAQGREVTSSTSISGESKSDLGQIVEGSGDHGYMEGSGDHGDDDGYDDDDNYNAYPNDDGSGIYGAAISRQLLRLINKLDHFIILFQNKFEDVEHVLKNDVKQLGQKLSRYENKLDTLGQLVLNKLGSVETYLGDKIMTLERRTQDLLDPVNDAISTVVANVSRACSTSVTSQGTNIDDQMLELKLQIKSLGNYHHLLSENYTKDQQDFVRNTRRGLERALNDKIDLMGQGVESVVHQLLSNITEGSPKLLSTVEHPSNISTECKPTQGDIIKLRSISATPSGPVSNISIENYPNGDKGLLLPYRCDALPPHDDWIDIQHRYDGSQSFESRVWEDYKNGFGVIGEAFWLGNERIHTLTSNGTFELKVELGYKGTERSAFYSTFSLSSEEGNYTLKLGDFIGGDAEDSLTYSNGMAFSTIDRDNDMSINRHCAVNFHGAWWYNDCTYANLNGKWGAQSYQGPIWKSLSGYSPVEYTKMSIRRVEKPRVSI